MYPELGANPGWDHEIDRAHGSVSRTKKVGTKHGWKRSAYVENWTFQIKQRAANFEFS
jgi:hypothetical protein